MGNGGRLSWSVRWRCLRVQALCAICVIASGHGSEGRSESPSDALALLSELELKANSSGPGYEQVAAYLGEVMRLVESNRLKSGEEFRRVGILAGVGPGEFAQLRVAYECFITALAKDDRESQELIADAWDDLLVSVSRPMRFDFKDRIHLKNYDELFEIEPAPAAVARVWRDPQGARSRAQGKQDNAEMIALEEADQADRQEDWSGFSRERIQDIVARDAVRRGRVRELMDKGHLVTPNDFARAALVMQHGRHFRSHQLAHELAVCSLLLGDREMGLWLVAASYDRMMYSLGHAQRFGSQSSHPRDVSGFCEEQRITFRVLPSP